MCDCKLFSYTQTLVVASVVFTLTHKRRKNVNTHGLQFKQNLL